MWGGLCQQLAMALLLILCISAQAFCAPFDNIPVTITQPDGRQIKCLASGDEFFNYYHDEHGNLIAPDPDSGYYVYVLQDANRDFYLTSIVVGRVDRSQAAAALKYEAAQNLKLFRPEFRSPQDTPKKPLSGPAMAAGAPDNAPSLGQFNVVVIFIRFADQSEFSTLTSTYDNMFNSTQTGYNSMKNYFSEVSYGQVSMQSYFYPTPGTTIVSYQDPNPRGYYSPYNATTNPDGYTNDRATREHTLLKNAVAYAGSFIPADLNVDADSDGYADGVVFVIRGGNDAWASLLWPHAWALYSYDVRINGKRIWNYSFQIETMMGSSVLCHEMGHNMGYPDLYRYYNGTITPVGTWDIMANNTGIPQHSGAYMKYKYTKWISTLPRITTSGFYTLEPLYSATNNVYRIDSPNSATEFFVVEFRKKNSTFEQSIPGEGLVIYRINTLATGNANGPPDEIYIYRPGGTNTTTNGSLSLANYNASSGRTAINDLSTPSGFLSGDTPGGLDISYVSAVGSTISFYVNINCAQPINLSSPAAYYGVIQTACNAASSGAVVRTLALTFDEDLLLTGSNPLTLKGGYNCAYSSNTGYTTIIGSMTLRGGPVTVENIIIR